MKHLRFLTIAVIVAATFTACKQDEYSLYNDVARMQFGPTPNRIYDSFYNLADTLKRYTFVYEEASATNDTVYFDIYAIGGTSNVDRNFVLEQEQVPNALNAIAGKHYVAFNDPNLSKLYVIKAGTVHSKVPVVLLRDPGLKTTTATLKLKVVANNNFQLGEQDKLWRKVEITDRLSQPASWRSAFIRVFGDYSMVKHQFLIDTTGDKWDEEFVGTLLNNTGLRTYYQNVCITALIDYNNANPNNPLTDENGELVTIP